MPLRAWELDCRHMSAMDNACGVCADRRIAELEAECAALQTTVAVMQRALWVALNGLEVVVHGDTPDDIEWSETEDGGQMVRRSLASRLARAE